MSKAQVLLDGHVAWFDKHYSPAKKFRKRELDDSAKQNYEDRSARSHEKLNMAWRQLYLGNFGNLPGMEVPDRRAPVSIVISPASTTQKSFPGFEDTWSSSQSLGGTGPDAPTQVPQLRIPERPRTSGCQRLERSRSTSTTASSGRSADRESVDAGLPRASSAPTLSSGSLWGTKVPMTSNQRYGWIETPKHLAYKQPKPKVRSEEAVYKEYQISKGIQYSPRIRFGTHNNQGLRRG